MCYSLLLCDSLASENQPVLIEPEQRRGELAGHGYKSLVFQIRVISCRYNRTRDYRSVRINIRNKSGNHSKTSTSSKLRLVSLKSLRGGKKVVTVIIQFEGGNDRYPDADIDVVCEEWCTFVTSFVFD